MILPDFEKAVSLAKRLSVLDQRTGSLIPFDLNEEQREVMRAALKHQRIIVVKGRQIGCSTVIAYFVTLAAVLNSGLPIAIIADEQAKAEGLLLKIKTWVKTLGLSLVKDNVRSCILSNGASIDALSAISTSEDGESRVGRSKSYGLIWGSEQAFWRNARAVWASVTSTAGLSAKILDESTGSPGGELFEDLARNAVDPEDEVAEDSYVRLFFGVEQHAAYRRDPNWIDDKAWERLQQDYGFSRRESASWWEWKRTTDFGGDTQRALREYPVTFEDAFAYPLGRYYREWRAVPVNTENEWNIYPVRMPEEPRVLACVSGRDAIRSSVAAVGMWSGEIHGTWTKRCEIPEYNDAIVAAWRKFEPHSVVVETSSEIGSEMLRSLARVRGLPVAGHRTIEAEWLRRRAALRTSIETGYLGIGEHVIEEVKKVFTSNSGAVEGDEAATVVKAISLGHEWSTIHPARENVPKINSNFRYVSPKKRKNRVKA
jgi:hypothetical protein